MKSDWWTAVREAHSLLSQATALLHLAKERQLADECAALEQQVHEHMIDLRERNPTARLRPVTVKMD